MALSTDLFDYHLPPHLIAQSPADKRDSSRLLVVDRTTRTLTHRLFSDLPEYLKAGDLLMRNNAAVLPARIFAKRPTGGSVECLLLRPGVHSELEAWWCLLRPGRKLPVGARFVHPSGSFAGVVLEKAEDGSALVGFRSTEKASVTELANRYGEVPLPPYIERKGTEDERPRDLERYQTVYANRGRQVAVAAPTAGLHFTPELLARLQGAGIEHTDLTLHVGLGTFRPIAAATVEEHEIHREIYEVPVATQQTLLSPRPGRRIAVGTTSVRTVEDFLQKNTTPLDRNYVGEAGLFIYPPRRFQGVDALITNFHQPRSTLLCLVSAFLSPDSNEGIDWVRQIYAEAIAREYRFFSYGDAMLIL